MDGHLVPVSSNSTICDSLENFTLDANAGSPLSVGLCGEVTATMQPAVWQNAGCKSLKNDSEDQATFQN